MKFLLPLSALAALGTLALAPTVNAQTLGAPYASAYSYADLGSVPGLPPSYGGLTLEAGDPNTLLIGGHANRSNGGIYAVSVVRDSSNHITGFSGSASLFASAPRIDGGLAYGPGGVLFYTTYSSNTIGEILPGSASADKIVSLSGQVASSTGTLAFVPAGFGGAGNLKILSYSSSDQYDATLSPDGAGTYDINGITIKQNQGGGPEGLAYVKGGNAGFSVDSALVSDYSNNAVYSYQVDANGDLIVGTQQDFLTGLSGAEGAFVDPLTGDFLFSTYGSSSTIAAVRGFTVLPTSATPEPGSVALLVSMGVTGAGILCKRRRK